MLNELAKEVHENAVNHGWWEHDIPFSEVIALIHSEVSEALEEDRDGKPDVYNYCKKAGEPCMTYWCTSYSLKNGEPYCQEDMLDNKPEGKAVELADVIIRILDYCGRKEIDIDEAIKMKIEYNKTRPYKHGGKAY